MATPIDITRVVRWTDEITFRYFDGVVKDIVDLLQKDSAKPIWLLLSSPGGSVEASFAFYDFVKFMKPDLNVIGMANVSSSAVPIFCSGNERIIFPHSKMILHEFRQSSGSNPLPGLTADDMTEVTRNLKAGMNHYADIVSRASKTTPKQILKLMKKRTVLMSAQAYDLGIATEVANPSP